MKFCKLICCILFFSVVIIIPSSCSPSEAVIQTAIAQTQIFDAQIQTAIFKTQNAMPTISLVETPLIPIEIGSATSTIEPMPTIEPTNTPSIKQITSIYSKITVPNFCSFTISEIEFSRRILPPNTSGYYSYYEAKSPDSTFLHIVANITNLNTIAKSADDLLSVNILYDKQYNYDSQAVVVDSEGDFSYSILSGIEPLLTREVHFLISVPNQVETSGKSIIINLVAFDQEYQYRFR